MSDRMMIGQLYPGKIHPAALHNDRKQVQAQSSPPAGTFQELLNENLLKISNHAAKRLEQRGIELKGDQLEQIQSAVEKAAAKGSKESLILMKDMALIVNIPNRTVVTAMDGKAMKDNVFTKIDSAVIIS
ncbi:flagellar operon protein [Paenibacillus vortex V453]|jgi:flagellar operon protein|uniref:Flagellar biosynthesis protein n=2 Tax=Paenibacillus TaxID=44249 RepID=A0A163ECV3_9BACL|nr:MULTISPECIES: TIGR02530 family flagellar biosynthesis protein [Paenibacillus]ANA83167.1 flagellar biosynthesis protein [Paenibacillus glucanolyticus]AVV57743.1 flagellar biosynthesis protein [Paenibacillus glucanolyticus]AWP26904.1 flagellar biosynthesis protein [Paenibacillus sp. Cedars]EFU40119.1 flagellar operon protein [Paenibacillus vortex V453]ETT34518.1 flagellar operon protein [Paenibacillus sp. FSL R5-808]